MRHGGESDCSAQGGRIFLNGNDSGEWGDATTASDSGSFRRVEIASLEPREPYISCVDTSACQCLCIGDGSLPHMLGPIMWYMLNRPLKRDSATQNLSN